MAEAAMARQIESGDIKRKWEYEEMKDFCRTILADYLRTKNWNVKWNHATFHFIKDHETEELSENEVTSLFTQMIKDKEHEILTGY